MAVLDATAVPAPASQEHNLVGQGKNTTIQPFLPSRRTSRRGFWVGSTRRCACSCHGTSWNSFARRLLWLEYTPLRQQCDNNTCDLWTVGSSLKLRLTNFGPRWNVIIQAQIMQRDGAMSLQPRLLVQRVTPRNSPGFMVIEDYIYYRLGFEQLKETLTTLARHHPSFRNHIDPDGMSYIQVSHSRPGKISCHSYAKPRRKTRRRYYYSA